MFKSTIAAGFAALCLTALPAQAETVLRMGTVAPMTSPWGQWAQGVADKIAEASKGELVIEIIGDAQLGDEQTIIRQAMRGRLDIAMVSNVPLSLVGQDLDILSSAHLFESSEQGTCVAQNHMPAIVEGTMEAGGLLHLATMEIGNYVVFSKEPIAGVEDLAGLKVRVAATAADEMLARKLGAVGVPMGTSDTIPALQTGNVDAAFLPTVFGIAIGTHTVAPNVTVSNHTRLIGTIAVSERVYQKLSDQEKEWLSTFGPASAQLSAMILGAEEALLGKIEAAGIPVTRLDEDAAQAWQDGTSGLQEELAESLGAGAVEILNQIEAAKAACAG